MSSLEERFGDSLTHTLGAYLALEGSGVLPAGQSAPGEIDEVVGDLGRSSRKQDGQFVRTTSAQLAAVDGCGDDCCRTRSICGKALTYN